MSWATLSGLGGPKGSPSPATYLTAIIQPSLTTEKTPGWLFTTHPPLPAHYTYTMPAGNENHDGRQPLNNGMAAYAWHLLPRQRGLFAIFYVPHTGITDF